MVALINPMANEFVANESMIVNNCTQHLGIGYLASALRDAGYVVDIYDCNVSAFTMKELLHQIASKRYDATTKISTEYYNLFVVEGETFKGHSFIIRKECALTMSEGVAPEISRRFAPLNAESKRDIETFPSLFACCTHQLGRAEITHNTILGLVTGIEVLDSSIRISFQGLCLIPRQRLLELSNRIGIQTAAMSNEFDRTHWAIKRLNLADELRKAGFNLPAPF